MRYSCGHSKKYHLRHGCDKIKEAPVNDRLAMALGMVPDRRNLRERVDDDLTMWGASVKYGWRR